MGESSAGSRVLERTIAIAVFFGCLAYLCLFLRYSSIELDEGIALQGAERILRGQIPYRDFFTFYTPGSFYLLALVLRIFGDSFMVARFSVAICGAICSLLTYVLARRVCSHWTAAFCAVLATVSGSAFRFLVLHNSYSTLFAFLTLYAAIRYLECRRPVWIVATGFFASTTVLIEQSKGAGVFGGVVTALVLLALFDRKRTVNIHDWLLFGAGAFGPLAAACTYFGLHHAFGPMLRDWLWPLQHYTKANHVPYGFQNWSEGTRDFIFHSGPLWLRVVKTITVTPPIMVPVLPLISIALLAYMIWQAYAKRVVPQSFGYYIVTCSVCVGLLASVVVVRPDSLHFMYLAPIWYLILAWILGNSGMSTKLLHRARPYLYAFVALTFGMLALATLLSVTSAQQRITTRRGVIKTNGEDTVIAYVQAHLPEGDRMLVYPYLPLYNYFTGTLSPARYDFFQPGMNTPDQAQQILESLQTGPPVLLQPAFSDTIPHSWAETPLKAIVSDPVMDYIARNYRICKVLKSSDDRGFWWMQPKNKTCP